MNNNKSKKFFEAIGEGMSMGLLCVPIISLIKVTKKGHNFINIEWTKCLSQLES